MEVVDLSADGRWFVFEIRNYLGSQYTIDFMPAEGGAIRKLPNHPIRAGECHPAFSPDGQVLAVGLSDGSLRLWRVSDYTLLATLKGHSGSITGLAFSPNGELLASLISPVKGMEARLYRDGRIVTYDRTHAKFLFESTYSVDWGLAPGSGMMTSGAFHDTILPDLKDVFSKSYTLKCNEVQVGGTTYTASWPYTGVNFYSVHYPGTSANSNMDWHTWLLGMQYVNGKPYLSAIMQFKWEP